MGTYNPNEAYFPLPSGHAYIRLPRTITKKDKSVLIKYLNIWKEFMLTKDNE